MKHIKLYESHNIYYQEMDNETFLKNQKNYTPFGSNFKIIDDMFKQHHFIPIIDYKSKDNFITYEIPENEKNEIVYKSISIRCCDDEWYYLKYFSIVKVLMSKNKIGKFIREKFYKCDQLEGLIKCLKELIN